MAKAAAKKIAKKAAAKRVTRAGATKKVAARKVAKNAVKQAAVKQAAVKQAATATPIDARARLLAGVSAFNAWRRSEPAAAVDLTGADLRGANLRDALLAGASMDGCRLDDAALTRAVLSGASLRGASLRRADLRGACFGPAELIDASLAMSPLGAALVAGASLQGASLAAARAQEARFYETDLQGVDLTDCEMTGADLRRTGVEDVERAQPPAADDTDAMLARLGRESEAVRTGLAQFALLMFLAGDRGREANGLLAAIGEGIGLSHEALQRMMPSGRIVIESYTVAPPSTDWARRVYFALMCGLASTSSSVVPAQLQVLGHFGAQFGLTDRAMARVIGEELGVVLTVAE